MHSPNAVVNQVRQGISSSVLRVENINFVLPIYVSLPCAQWPVQMTGDNRQAASKPWPDVETNADSALQLCHSIARLLAQFFLTRPSLPHARHTRLALCSRMSACSKPSLVRRSTCHRTPLGTLTATSMDTLQHRLDRFQRSLTRPFQGCCLWRWRECDVCDRGPGP